MEVLDGQNRSQHPAQRADQDHRHDVVTIRRRGSRGTHRGLACGGEAERHVARVQGDVPTEDHQHHGQRGCGAQDGVAEVAQPAVLGVGGAEPDLDRLGQAFATSRLAEVTVQELVGGSVPRILRRQPGIDPRNRFGDIRLHLLRAVQLHDERLCGVEVVVGGLDEGATPPVAQPPGHGVAPRGRGPSLLQLGSYAGLDSRVRRGPVGRSCLGGIQPRLQDVRADVHILCPPTFALHVTSCGKRPHDFPTMLETDDLLIEKMRTQAA